jgi:hypothetical protein
MRRMTGMVAVDPMGAMPMPGWQWMTMGVVRFGYNRQGGDRGDEGFESTNWFMWMAHHELGPGRVTFMMMNSLEPATIPDPGSPELFQTGETFDGEPLVDYQHPHDFFANLSVTYRAAISPNAGGGRKLRRWVSRPWVRSYHAPPPHPATTRARRSDITGRTRRTSRTTW